MENESFERALQPQPGKRKRSSILKQADKRANTQRESRTVSFKEMYDIFLSEDMDLTMMDIVEPSIDMELTMVEGNDPDVDYPDQTDNQNTMGSQDLDLTLVPPDVSIQMDTSNRQQSPTPSPEKTNNTIATQISDISSLNLSNISTQFANDTLYGAFHDSNNISFQSSRTSEADTLMHNIDALNECIQRVDQESEECKRRLDDEIGELFKFYRHIIHKENPYEFAIAIFGLRYSLWLLIKVNPETYPNEKLRLRFAVNKKDRHLYPFAEFANAVTRCTKEGSYGYLTRFVINAQKFRRFLRKIGYNKTTK